MSTLAVPVLLVSCFTRLFESTINITRPKRQVSRTTKKLFNLSNNHFIHFEGSLGVSIRTPAQYSRTDKYAECKTNMSGSGRNKHKVHASQNVP